MALILRETKGSKLTSSELDSNFTYLDNKSSGGGSGLTQLKVSLTKEEVFSAGTILLEAPGVNKYIDVITAYVIPRNVTNLKDDFTGSSPSQSRISSYIVAATGSDISLIYKEDISFYLESGNPVKYFPIDPDTGDPNKSVVLFNSAIAIIFGGATPPYTSIPTSDGNFPDTKGGEVVVTGSITGSSASMISNDNGYALFLDSSFSGSFTHSEVLSWTDSKGSGTFSLTSEDKYSFGPWSGTMDFVLSYQIIDLD